MTISSSRENIDKFINDLTQRGLKVELRNIGNYSKKVFENELTSRQFTIFSKAKSLGYYDVLSRITLTDLAKNLQMAKSSLSTMIQRIHNKLLGYKHEKSNKIFKKQNL